MAIFGGTKPRATVSGTRPYFPTPEEQATAIPGLGQMLLAATGGGPTGGVFGAGSTYRTPGYGDGILGAASQGASQGSAQPTGRGSILANALAVQTPVIGGQPATIAAPSANAEQPPRSALGEIIQAQLPQPAGDPSLSASARKPKFFGRGGLGWDILGSLGDAFATAGGGQATYWPQKLAQQKHQRELMERTVQWQRQRQAERDEWTWRENYKREHPDDQFTQYMRAAGIDPASPQGQALYRQRAESMAAPPLMAIDGYDPQGNPTKTFMPRTAIGAGGRTQAAGPPPGTVRNGFRYNGGNPNDRNSWVPVGGASSAGGATFR